MNETTKEMMAWILAAIFMIFVIVGLVRIYLLVTSKHSAYPINQITHETPNPVYPPSQGKE